MPLKESSFPDCQKVSSVVPVFKEVGETSTTAKLQHPVTLHSVANKMFEELVNNMLADHLLEKYGLFF